MESGKIFQMSDPREILIQIFQDKKERNPSFSIRAWARHLGFKNPSYLSEVLRGKIKLKPSLALKISKSLDVPEDERRYFEALVFHEDANSDGERDFYAAAIKKYRPLEEKWEIEENFLDWAKSWVYFLPDELILLKDFREDFNYLAKRVGRDATPQMLELAFKDFEEHKLIQRDSKGKLIRKHVNWIPPRNTAAQRKSYYERVTKKLLEKTQEAYFSQPAEETTFRSSPVPIRKKDIPKIQEFLLEVAEEFRKRFEPKQGMADEIFSLNINFFKLTLGQPDLKDEED